ncbi:MAG: site-specific recombinase [Clostridia bacterium]|nr:site-specific recombinase [Clostridia bacterium]
MKKCIAVYLRLSLEDVDKRTNKTKDDSNSIMAQRQIVQRHISGNPYLSGLPQMEFCDDGFSGTNFERPDFQRMIDLIRDGEISIVIVKDLSRFGRDYLEVGDYLEHIFPFLGIRIISINDHYDSEDYIGNTAGMDIAFRNLIYDYYSKDLSKKVKTAMNMKQKDGGYVSCCLYGYKVLPERKHQMVIDSVTAPIVQRIFKDVISGKTTSQVARELNAEGIPTPLSYKKITRKTGNTTKAVWSHQRIISMVQNVKYTGCMVNHTRESRKIRDKAQRRVPKDEWYVHENAHEAIVTKEEFEAANAMLRKVRKYRKKAPEVASPFYCSHCGRKLQRTHGNDDHLYCMTAYWSENEPCKSVRWDRMDIEDVLLEALKAQISLLEVKAKEVKQQSHTSDGTVLRQHIKSLTEELESGDAQKIQSYLDYREGRISKEDFITLRGEREARHEELKAKISQAEIDYEEYLEVKAQADKDRAVVRQTSAMTDADLKAIMYDAIERVNVTDGEHIEIVWKFDNHFGVA